MEDHEPLTPNTQYLSTSALSLTIIGVWEAQDPIDVSQTKSLIENISFPSPRFLSIIEKGPNGEKYWKRLNREDVNVDDHVKVPVFPSGLTPNQYEEHLKNYISDISLEKFAQDCPLWEIHIITYPTTNAAGNWILKLHHTLGDGFSLMGNLFSFLRRADNPSLPLTIPSIIPRTGNDSENNGKRKSLISRLVHEHFPFLVNSVSDLCTGLMRSTVLCDERTPVRSAVEGNEFLPHEMSTMTFSLDQTKQIKSRLKVTVNDVICGIIYYGCRIYMEKTDKGSGKARSTSMIFLNTRITRNYASMEEMHDPKSKAAWGNLSFFVHIPLPKLSDPDFSDPLDFIRETHNTVSKKKKSAAVFIFSRFLEIFNRLRGHEAVAEFLHKAATYSSVGLTNVVGPLEQAALGNQTVKGMYFTVAGCPASLLIGIISYNGTLSVTLSAEKNFIDVQKLQECIENAFKIVFESACKTKPSN